MGDPEITLKRSSALPPNAYKIEVVCDSAELAERLWNVIQDESRRWREARPVIPIKILNSESAPGSD